jgi:hypothetical protein
MHRPLTRLLIVLVLPVWVVCGPVGMAFNGCILMGGMCEAVCGIASSISGPAPAGGIAFAPIAYLAAGSGAPVASVVSTPPSPPPKLALLSA